MDDIAGFDGPYGFDSEHYFLLFEKEILWFQMWFDANGRAYVSLATRYDPVRK